MNIDDALWYTPKRVVKCSFCGKKSSEGGYMIKGKKMNSYICDKCVEMCAFILCSKHGHNSFNGGGDE